MWYENYFVDQARAQLDIPISPLWIASSTCGHEVGSANGRKKGHFYVFGSMCAFLASDVVDRSHGAADGGNYSMDVNANVELAMFRISYRNMESIFAEGSNGLRVTSQGCVYKFDAMEERSAVLNALVWLTQHAVAHADDSDEFSRSAIMYPEATKKIRALVRRSISAAAVPYPGGGGGEGSMRGAPTTASSDEAPEYVVQDIDGAIVTNHRLLFATTSVRLSSIPMMHIGDNDIKMILSDDLTVQLHCSQQRQSLISSVWLASLPLWTDLLGRVPQDPHRALKAHVKTLSRLHMQFCAIDTSRDGRLSRDEILSAIGCLFPDDSFIDGFFFALDSDASGEISLLEFLGGMTKLVSSDTTGRIRFSFQMFDRDRSGNLDQHELYDAMRTLSATGDLRVSDEDLHECCAELFRVMDADGSGTISVEEYTDAILHNPEAHAMFRRIGLYDGGDCFKMSLSSDLLMVGNRWWFILAAVKRALLTGLVAARSSTMADSGVGPEGSIGDSGSIGPLSNAAFVEERHLHVNVSNAVLQEFGQPWSGDHVTDSAAAGSHVEAVSPPTHGGPTRRDRIPSTASAPHAGRAAASRAAHLVVSAPEVFDRIRLLHDINAKDFRNALGVDNLLANMLLGSATLLSPINAVDSDAHPFKFLSHDGAFLVRSVTPKEKSRLMLQLPQYFTHMMGHPNSLLPRYFGLFSIFSGDCVPKGERFQLHFVVQLNGFRACSPRHSFVRVRGPTFGEVTALPQNGIESFDLAAPIRLDFEWRDAVSRQAAADVRYLSAVGACDYALMIAVPTLPVAVRGDASHRQKSEFFMDTLALIGDDEDDDAVMMMKTATGCCRSSTRTKPKSKATSWITSSNRHIGRRAAALQNEDSSWSSGLSLSAATPLDSHAAFRRAANPRLTHSGGLFYLHGGGVPQADRGTATLVFVDVLSAFSERSASYGKQVLEALDDALQKEPPRKPERLQDTTARLYAVHTETGREARIGVDHSQKLMILTGLQDERLLAVNLTLARERISVVRDLQPYGERSRKRATIRCGFDADTQALRPRGFVTAEDYYFADIQAREMFLSELREALSGDGRRGVHVRKLKIMTITWNVDERLLGDLGGLLGRVKENHCDLLTVCVQDCTFPIPGFVVTKSCEQYLVQRIAAHLPDFDLVSSASVWSTRLVIFTRRGLSQHVSGVVKATTGSYLGNSNAVGIGFKLFDTSICVLNMRFAERGDFNSSTSNLYDLLEGLPDLESEGIGVLSAYHHVFLCGDLKYRNSASFHDIIAATRSGDNAAIVDTDQLRREMASGDVYCGFEEAPVTFRPTTHFLLTDDHALAAGGGGGDTAPPPPAASGGGGTAVDASAAPRVYDEWSEGDAPTWSHRILYHGMGHPVDIGVCLTYDADFTVRSSRCAPVFALHEISARLQVVCPTRLDTTVVGIRFTDLRCLDLIKFDVCQLFDSSVQMFFPYFSRPRSETRTPTISLSQSPHWRGQFTFPTVPTDRVLLVSDYLHFGVFDEGSVGRAPCIGSATLPLDRFAQTNTCDVTLPLVCRGRRTGWLSVTIELIVDSVV